MTRMTTLAILLIAISILSAQAFSPANAGSSLADRDAALARLDARADALQRRIGPGPIKIGALERQAMRAEIREIRGTMDQLVAGAAPDPEQIARLIGERPVPAPLSSQRVSYRADQRQEIQRRRLVAGPKIGALERARIRSDLDDLDRLIADLEAGREIELARIDALLDIRRPPQPQTAEQRLRSLEIERTTLTRNIVAGPKTGIVERVRIRDEIDSLDAMITSLEDRL